jgi:hypothetical protein
MDPIQDVQCSMSVCVCVCVYVCVVARTDVHVTVQRTRHCNFRNFVVVRGSCIRVPLGPWVQIRVTFLIFITQRGVDHINKTAFPH